MRTSESESIADQLARFNRDRERQFGRAPTSEKPLPMMPTGRGGDILRPDQNWNDFQ